MKYIFLDRDGVINKDPGGWTQYNYVTRRKELEFLPVTFEALRLLKAHGFAVIIISNQAGVGKGHFTKADLAHVDKMITDEIKKYGGAIEESFYCVHTSSDNCACRKPKPGLLRQAIDKYDIDPKTAYFIGDSEGDIEAGRMAGTQTVLVFSGKTARKDMRTWHVKPDYMFANLLEAVKWIVERDKRKRTRHERRRTKGD